MFDLFQMAKKNSNIFLEENCNILALFQAGMYILWSLLKQLKLWWCNIFDLFI